MYCAIPLRSLRRRVHFQCPRRGGYGHTPAAASLVPSVDRSTEPGSPSMSLAGAPSPAEVASDVPGSEALVPRGVRRNTAVPRARSGPSADASSSQTDRTCPSFSYVLVESLPVTTTGSPLRSEATALPASARQQVTLRNSDAESTHRPPSLS